MDTFQGDRRVQKERDDGMSEAIAFFCGMITMMIVWFVTDTLPKTSPYGRGYRDGYREAVEAYKGVTE